MDLRNLGKKISIKKVSDLAQLAWENEVNLLRIEITREQFLQLLNDSPRDLMLQLKTDFGVCELFCPKFIKKGEK